MRQPLLDMRGIVKSFSGVRALNGVSIQLDRGEALSICGENGSGKSTLMKVLSGVWPYGSYEGEIFFEGNLVKASSIRDTETLGIVIIHQELALVKELSVQENIFLGNELGSFARLNDEEMYRRTTELLARVKLDVLPGTPVRELGVGQQQLVEIAKALNKNVKLLILDEPTSSLTNTEIDILLKIVSELKQQGIACVYISHKLDEVLALSDWVTVIRDGDHIDTKSAAQLTQNDIISMMVGRDLDELFPREEHDIGDVILRVKHAIAKQSGATRSQVEDVSFELRHGEILGIAGLIGSGRTELMQCLYGSYEGQYEAEVELEGQIVSIRSQRAALEAGIAMVPEDRKRHGIVPIMSVGRNITLSVLDQYSSWFGAVNEDKESNDIDDYIAQLKVKTASADLSIKNLSGGNQQKAIIAKCLLTHPKILILDEPTRGIDVGAKYEIYKLMFALVKQGMSIIMVSSELSEVIGISDRVLVMHEGRLKGQFDHQGLTQEMIMNCAIKEGVENV
ncbi:xylose ABC transporter ATP-binding protein [Marinomonas sp. M1K-6]|uniref:Xylose ABC transporter ATP-binding protein n=1 Tax=Marinomonas profundi TaxID=2726122 RepID=A0A847R1Y7_9GAMM|nr:xylose ABC transporter ATP-binding protein [Marinomonas profundi]NLQ16223.1 xylose ABC transporter ATP-binding protein [Marinomonas profundi]UDV03198.1 xylose ABC transporter ATP-binding protein [Marinomonas profundi]